MPSTQGRRIAILALAATVMTAPSSRAAEDRPDGAQAAADKGLADSLALLEAWVEAQRAYLDIPGISMAVVHGKDVIWSKGFGLANREAKLPAASDTLYSICSISKLFTSLGVLQMRDEGKLALDEPIATYLPWFDVKQQYADSPPVTLRGILTHSSGLPRESAQPYWTGPDFAFPTREAMIAGLESQQTLYPADTYFQYSNLGLTLAGEVVAAVSGEPYADHQVKRILQPLGMKDTTPWLPEAEHGKRLAMGYGRRKREGEREPVRFFQTDAIAPAAGYASTALDLARFAGWQLDLLEKGGKDVVAASTLREMQHVHWMDPDWKTSWGLGFSVWRYADTTMVGHGGSCPGYRTEVAIAPADGFGVAYLSNAIDGPTRIFTQGAYDLVAPALKKIDERSKASSGGTGAAAASPGEGATTPTAGVVAPPSFDATRYTGIYESSWGEAVIVPWEGGLAILGLPSETPRKSLEKLRHVNGDTFRRVRDDGELAETVVFELDATGKVARAVRHGNSMEKAR
jgi:CubicO group peptidase (beta-lactamase class C family)